MNDKSALSNQHKHYEFKEEEYIAPFLNHLELISQDIAIDEPLVVYRTQHIIPVDEYGQTPNILRARKGIGRRTSRKYSKEEVENLTPEQRTSAIGKFGLSCNSSEEAAEASFIAGYKKLKQNGASEKELEEYIIRRGENICKYIITKDAALVTKFRNEHANIYLYRGVELEDCRDKSYEPRKIDYQSYD